MTVREVAVDVLLGLGVGIEALCALGLLVFRSVFDRLHLLGPAGTLGALCITGAVALDTPLVDGGLKALLVAVILMATGPMLSHALGRAATLTERAPTPAGVADKEEAP
jgi:multicomponent Na+:H+ antiporter subunit G